MDNIKKTELNHLQTDLQDEMSHNRQCRGLLVLAMIVTLISYLFFSGHLKLGNPLYWGEYFNKGAVTITAFWFMLFSVILLGVFLAWVKHFAYSHFTTYRAIAGVMVTLIGFALLAEMFAALEDQKAKADIQLEGNSAYQATIQPTVGAITASPSLSGDIGAASQRVARCEENLKRGKEKHCEGDKAKLAALEKQQSAALNAQVAATEATEKLRFDRQDKMKADAHNDFIVGIAKFYAGIFGTGAENGYVAYIPWANITLMLIIAIAFERLHAFLIEAGRNIKGNIRGIEQRIAQLQEGSNPLAEGKHLPPNGSPLFRYQEPVKDGGFKQTGIGFTAPVGNKKQGFVGFIPPGHKAPERETPPAAAKTLEPAIKDDAPVLFEGGGKQTPEQREWVLKEYARRTGQTYRQELAGGGKAYRDQALDAPAPALPAKQKAGGTGLQNPALGTAEQHFPLPIEEPEKPRVEPRAELAEKPRVEPRARGLLEPDENHVHAVANEPVKAQAAEARDGADSLYPEWVVAVRAKECRPTVNHSRLWIQRRIAPTMTGSKTNDLKRIDAMRKGFFARAIREGLMQLNANYTNGGKKYLWVG
ncbi:hypothetical protein VSS37_03520 [Candidatus Thiothrix sp. Deng01]|uniref:Uncharacterized protein n=1 Tax=Candidatus Thiothrix phosphatis TaxID=3112415 RepID=A0ABU6CT98_9GAMM|nr:hypothetical protein [Candidatus Thiothrix sp. Deng01]MEB4590040.1 hypothetical protein [Candidatus Thiothrix sp. Deng01]